LIGTNPGDLVYVAHDEMDVLVLGGSIIDMHATIDKALGLSDVGGGMLGWSQDKTTHTVCTGSFCEAGTAPPDGLTVVDNTTGAIPDDPSQLKSIGGQFYFLIVDDSLAMTKQ
jgi:hypothetical protein